LSAAESIFVAKEIFPGAIIERQREFAIEGPGHGTHKTLVTKAMILSNRFGG